MKNIFLILFFLAACTHLPSPEQTSPPTQASLAEKIIITKDQPLYEQGKKIVFLGGLSDLFFARQESTPQLDIYYSITDRGPNGQEKKEKGYAYRPFPVPSFPPQILKISYDKQLNKAQVVAQIPLSRPDGTKASGRPNVDPRQVSFGGDEIPVDGWGKAIDFDPWGLDTEGLVVDPQGGFWVSEEYGPSLLKISADGRILKRWIPVGEKKWRTGLDTLPAFLASRKLNRGFEALTWTQEGHLLVFLQSEIPEQKIPFSPVIEFDPVGEKAVGLYFYPLDPQGGKIGAATLRGDGQILVVEQSGHKGNRAWQKIFSFSTQGADNLLQQAEQGGRHWHPSSFKPGEKREFFDLTASGLGGIEKLEGLAINEHNDIVLVNDNDFSMLEKGSPNYLIFVRGVK